VHKNSVLAHERLAIVDVEHGSQPLCNKEGTVWLAVNGEVYNHVQLREELPLDAQKQYVTSSDCESVLHLYPDAAKAAKRDEDVDIAGFLNKLNGIWAFVLSDERNDRFIAARDHMGIIPLYYGHDAEGAVWVSSEMKALADACVTFEDFPPGHYFDSRGGKVLPWYRPLWHDETRVPTDTLDLPRLRQGLEDAVERQLMSDVPFGVLLSGGLDSSLIASIAARIYNKRAKAAAALVADGKLADTDGIGNTHGSALWSHTLHSFSVGLKDSPDLKAARQVASHIKSIHHEFNFTIEEGLHAIQDVIYHLETYDVTTIRAATPMYLMARKIKCLGVKMVLSGEGADEMFGGYLYFHKAPSATEHQKETVRKLKGLFKFDCLRANKATAAWGVEARVPFLDRVFLDYAMEHVAAKDKLCGRAAQPAGRIEKWVLREAFAGQGYLPDEILWRQKEQFSDGVGYGWIDSLKLAAEKQVSDADLRAAAFRFPHNPPATKEAFYFRRVFEQHFPQPSARLCVPGGPSIACSTPTALLWDASFRQFADCSGRSVAGVHSSAYDEQRRQLAKGEQLKDEHLAKVADIALPGHHSAQPVSVTAAAGAK